MEDKPTPGQNFAINMKSMREERQWSQGELARLMTERGFKWYPATVYSVEQGERKLPLDEALALTEIFDSPLTVLTATPHGFQERVLLDKAIGGVTDIMGRIIAELAGLRQMRQILIEVVDQLIANGTAPDHEADPGSLEYTLARAQQRIQVTEPGELLRSLLASSRAEAGGDIGDNQYEIELEPIEDPLADRERSRG